VAGRLRGDPARPDGPIAPLLQGSLSADLGSVTSDPGGFAGLRAAAPRREPENGAPNGTAYSS